MEGIKSRLSRLLDQDEWTEDDKQWLLDYLEHDKTRELDSLMHEAFSENSTLATKLDKESSEELLQRIHEKIGVTQPTFQHQLFARWHKSLAAAVIGFLILGTYLLYENKWGQNVVGKDKSRLSNQHKNLQNDIAPGGNKALLTLADGTTIILDDAQNGTLTSQGKTNVLKINGRLTYENGNEVSEEVLYNTISTPRGGEYQIRLQDGTQVWLNAASSIRFPASFKGKERRIQITGEAYFEVARNPAIPFIVTINSSEVKVLGTHFNIMAYPEEALLKTTLLEGSVQFNSDGHQTVLKPGQQSQLIASGGVKVIDDVDVEKVIAWKNGMFHFDKTDVATMMRQIARWYDVDVVYQNHNSDEKFIADIPRNTNLSDALKALELTGKIKFEVEGKKVIVR